MSAPTRLLALDVIFGDGEEGERPELAQLIHLRRHGACTGAEGNVAENAAVFYPQRGQSAVPAKVRCWACPVQAECLSYALERPEGHGVWGGTNEKERRALHSLRRQGVPLEDIVAMAVRHDLDAAMAQRRSPPHQSKVDGHRAAPYGWRVDGGQLAVNEREQGTLVRLLAWARDGVGPTESARRLNVEGIRARRGPWHAGTVVRILSRARPASSWEQRAS